jgi:hypothetical protein
MVTRGRLILPCTVVLAIAAALLQRGIQPVVRAQEAVQVVRTDLLGDPLPAGAVARIGTSRLWFGRSLSTGALAYTPDGKFLLASGTGDAIQVWDVATGTLKRRMEPAGSGVRNFVFPLTARQW